MSSASNPLSVEKRRSAKAPACPMVQKWLLRILLDLEAVKEWAGDDHVENDSIAYALGMGDIVEDLENYSKHELIRRLRERQQVVEAQPDANFGFEGKLRANLDLLGRLIGMSDVELKLLGFLVIAKVERAMVVALDHLNRMNALKVVVELSTILDIPERDLRQVLSKEGMLIRCGIVERVALLGFPITFSDFLKFIDEEFPLVMMHARASVDTLFKRVFRMAPPSELQRDDYDHMGDEVDRLLDYVRHALATGRQGVNILIHGRPGTGKTELTRYIAGALNIHLFEISAENEKGEGMSGSRRLRALRIAQSVLVAGNQLLVLDECEDVFGNDLALNAGGENAAGYKGWINQSLEENRVPTFWLTNSVRNLDPAYVRRFYVIEAKAPSRRQRRKMISKLCGGSVSAELVERLSAARALTPAVIKSSHQAVTMSMASASQKDREQALMDRINAVLKAQGHTPLPDRVNSMLPLHYDPEYCNTDVQLQALAEGMAKNGSARLLFHGPPGTGKSAYVHWLADYLGRPLIAKRGSDLLSPYVGMTEQQLASSFEEANNEEALLLIDEIDAFLSDRRTAHYNWERTMVSELLVQMEQHQGIFIGTSNFMNVVDHAAFRRFDALVKFDYLQPSQALELLRATTEQLALPPPEAKHLQVVEDLGNLTPGDFQQLIRRSRFHPFEDTTALVAFLTEIARRKPGRKRPMGFIWADR